jgi:competence protein ComEC
VETPGKETTLVDAGPNTELYGQAQNQVLRYLAMRGIGRLDRVIVSHPHDDHYGGLVSLLENVGVGEIVAGSLAGEAEYERMLTRAQGKGVKLKVVAAGDRWESGGAAFEVLHSADPGGAPGEQALRDPNSQSVVIRLSFGDIGIMLTGDVTPEAQREIAQSEADLNSEMLKVPHHGARNWIDPGFLRRLGARVAVVSVGSRFASHPSPETLAQLAASGIQTFITCRDGAVTVLTDGHTLEIKTEAEGRLAGRAILVPGAEANSRGRPERGLDGFILTMPDPT